MFLCSLASTRVGWLKARSLSDKTTAVYETIDDRFLDVLAVTEMWHRSSDDLSLRVAALHDGRRCPSCRPRSRRRLRLIADESAAPRCSL